MEAARRLLQAPSRVVVLTGAGISEESGVPTFRGPGGLWRRYRPEDLATPDAFARDPLLVWQWYDWRRQRIAAVEPNPAHRALAALEQRTPDFVLATQNVDDLHERAGSQRILRLHGDIWLLKCSDCGSEERNRKTPLADLPPRCSCGGVQRPGVVWFSETLPAGAWADASAAAEEAEVFLVVGTSALVQPAAWLPQIALRAGARLIEVNFDETPLSSVAHISLRGKAGELLPQIVCPS